MVEHEQLIETATPQEQMIAAQTTLLQARFPFVSLLTLANPVALLLMQATAMVRKEGTEVVTTGKKQPVRRNTAT